MSVIVVELPGEPRPKERPRYSSRSGTFYTPAKTKAYEDALKVVARAARGRRKMLTGALAMRITATVKIPVSYKGSLKERATAGIIAPVYKPDLDNLIKAAKDALNGVIYRDDSQVCELVARKEYGAHPSIRIEITELDLSASPFRPLRVAELPMIGEA